MLQHRVKKLITAGSAKDALTVTKGYVFDVVLTDIHMPEMDGVALFKALRKQAPDLPIIAVTGNASPKERDHYLHLGFRDVIAKPFEIQDIMQTLQTLYNPVDS
jgi:two-component system capsular synthesis sensor histidine kinase RcsC